MVSCIIKCNYNKYLIIRYPKLQDNNSFDSLVLKVTWVTCFIMKIMTRLDLQSPDCKNHLHVKTKKKMRKKISKKGNIIKRILLFGNFWFSNILKLNCILFQQKNYFLLTTT